MFEKIFNILIKRWEVNSIVIKIVKIVLISILIFFGVSMKLIIKNGSKVSIVSKEVKMCKCIVSVIGMVKIKGWIGWVLFLIIFIVGIKINGKIVLV